MSERAERRAGVDRSVNRRKRANKKLSQRKALARQLGGLTDADLDDAVRAELLG